MIIGVIDMKHSLTTLSALCIFRTSCLGLAALVIMGISPVYAHDPYTAHYPGPPPEKLPPSNVATEGATHPNLASQATDPTAKLIQFQVKHTMT